MEVSKSHFIDYKTNEDWMKIIFGEKIEDETPYERVIKLVEDVLVMRHASEKAPATDYWWA